MASVNTKRATNPTPTTHEGGVAKRITPAQKLARVLNACMLWEDTFYVDGETAAKTIQNLVPLVTPETAKTLAIKARTEQKLRHAPLLLVREMLRASARHRLLVADTLEEVIQRPDELTEFLAIYWKSEAPTPAVPVPTYRYPKQKLRVKKTLTLTKQPLAAQVKKGLARAFRKFDEYSLAKYNRDNEITLRDVLFLIHAKPVSQAQQKLWEKLVQNELATPDTWETALSSGADKKQTFTRLIDENKLGSLALLRNLRNMEQAGVPDKLVREALVNMNPERVLPFRFIAAAMHAPRFESELEQAMFKNLNQHDKLEGKTVLLVDVSGSMDKKISDKSEMSRLDAACGLAMLLREICESVVVYSFSNSEKHVPARRGFALNEAIRKSQPHQGTMLGSSAKNVAVKEPDADRVIVITDEQSHDAVNNPFTNAKAYVVNVASYENGVGYGNGWTHVDGWSESIVDYILAEENDELL